MKSKARIIFRFCILAATGTGIFSFMKSTPQRPPSPEQVREINASLASREIPPLESYLEYDLHIQDTDETVYPDEDPSTDSEESLFFSDQELRHAYSDISGSVLFDMYSDLDSYFEQAGNEETFSLSDESNGEYHIEGGYNLDDVNKAYISAEAKDEKDALDQAFMELYPSLMEMASTLEDIANYTNSSSYYDDNYEAAQAYHTALLETYNKYMRALRLFVRELDAAQQ